MFGLLALIPGVASGLLSWLNKKTDAELEKFKAGVTGDTAINVEEIRTRVGLAQIAADTRNRDREHWSTRWMVPTAFAVFGSHAAAVVFDSMPLFGHVVGSWGVAALPPQYATMQTSVILTICGVSAGGAVLAPVIKRIFTR